jgi:hypothetical protein
LELFKALEMIGEEGCLPQVEPEWQVSRRVYPSEGAGFLTDAAVAENALFAGFAPEDLPELQATAALIRRRPALSRLAWHCYRSVFDGPKAAQFKGWPDFKKALGARQGMLFLLAGLAGVPRVRAWHKSLGIPENITRDTCREVWDFCANHRRGHSGVMGCDPGQLSWLRHYAHEPYFRLGRLEYWLRPFGGGVQVFRNRETQEVVALADDGSRHSDEGFRISKDLDTGWLASLQESPEEIAGFPISPLGMAVNKQLRLPAPLWSSVLRKGDLALDMHIPQGGALTPAACADSQRRAMEFFPKYFSDGHFAGMVCNSWMFNTQLEEILPPTANLVQFMRDLYLFPVHSTGQDGLWFIFLQEPLDLKTAPRETSLQRAVAGFLDTGRKWRGGGMFILREDALKSGEQRYRKNWPPRSLRDSLADR